MPEYLAEVIATFSHLARASTHVNQRSGVSVRLSRHQLRGRWRPTRCAAALRAGERVVVARVDDLDALAASSSGKIEIESLDEGREGAIFENLVKGAVLTVFKERVAARADPRRGRRLRGGRRSPTPARTSRRPSSPASSTTVAGAARARSPRSPGATSRRPRSAAAVEFVLEGLHLSKRLNKDTARHPAPPTAAATLNRVVSAVGSSRADSTDERFR